MMIEPLQIGDLKLATNLLLAPMAGYVELPFRLIVRRLGGVGLASTPLLHPQGVLHTNRRSTELAATAPGDSPLAFQLFGSDADSLCDAARWAEARGADVIDLNMGCPVHKVTRKNGGSRLLCEPDRAARLAEQVVRAVPRTPVTVKMRLGWDESSIVAPGLAAMLERAGVCAITVHGRTARMKFSGKNRLDAIAEVVAAVQSIPVVGNGGVRTPQDAADMLAQTGCRGVMIGSAALSTPWIFRDTWSYLTTGSIPPPPDIEERCELMRDHFRSIVRFRGERSAVLEFRKFAVHYARQLKPSRAFRDELRGIQSVAEFEQAVQRFLASPQALDASTT